MLFFYLYPISIHCCCIFLYLYSVSVHFYCMFFVSILYSIICIQYSIFCPFLLYMFRFYSIFNHLYLIINDLYAIVFHSYSMNSIYIPKFSFVFYITIFVLYNSDLIAIARKGPLEGLKSPIYKLGELEKWRRYRFVQDKRHCTELIDELKLANSNLHKLARAKFRNILLP